MVESDSKTAISLASSEIEPPWALVVIVVDIKARASQLAISFSWAKRKCNLAARCVAKIAFNSLDNFVWDVNFSDEITSSKEEKLEPLDVPMQNKEKDPVPLDILYPNLETASTSRGTNTRGQPHYGLRSLGSIKEELFMVKQPYSLVKVTNAVLGLRALKAKVGCSVRKKNS
nr:ribonuclease H protein [Tanacetum cinerariifolium]